MRCLYFKSARDVLTIINMSARRLRGLKHLRGMLKRLAHRYDCRLELTPALHSNSTNSHHRQEP